jgi:hypothetical protein
VPATRTRHFQLSGLRRGRVPTGNQVLVYW